MKCQKCGYEADSKFCPNCGAKLEEEIKLQVEQNTTTVDENEKDFANKPNFKISGEIDESKRFSKQWLKHWSPVFIVIAIILLGSIVIANTSNVKHIEPSTSSEAGVDTFEESTTPEKTIPSVNTKDLVENYERYDDKTIITTIKVNNIEKDKDGFSYYNYIRYGFSNFNKISIKIYLSPNEKINIGDYVTVKGTCSVYDINDELEIDLYGNDWLYDEKDLFVSVGDKYPKFKKISTKKLCNDPIIYDEEFITTTIKVTSADKSKGKYQYTLYETDGYEKVNFTIYLDAKKKINKGDYLTVSGKCTTNDSYDDLKIKINALKKEKTDLSLFVDIGGTETKPIIYSEDYYKVGKDIPAGTYIAYPTGLYSAYYGIYSDANGDDIIANNNFDGQNYFTVSNGQYLDLTRCEARPVSQRQKVEYDNGYLTEGQYLVGVDVPAGEYKLTCTSDYSAYYALTSDTNSDNIISNDNFDNSRYVYISNGQYLELVRCKMKVK
ncbi:MAG: zinc ribbon domain-containing protein [Ruminococcus sp.]